MKQKTKNDFYTVKVQDIRKRARERAESQAWSDVHKKHQIKIGANRYIDNLKSDNKKKNKFYSSSFFRLCLIIFVSILLVRVFFVVNSSTNQLSFTSFLDFLSNLNTVDIDLSFPDYSIGGSWGVFDGLRLFFNIFTTVFSMIVWLFKNALNLFNYIIAILNFLFS